MCIKLLVLLQLIIVLVNIVSCDIYYRQVHLSEYCGDKARSVLELGVSDAKSIASLEASRKTEDCEVVQNCSLFVQPPKGQAIDVSPQHVTMAHNVGSLSIYIDERLAWFWDETWNKANTTAMSNDVTKKDGQIEIVFEMNHAASTWKHAKFDILFTAFLPIDANVTECPQPFYFDCLNNRCVREALRCDGKNNCGNWQDEVDCGITKIALIVLVAASTISIIFFLVVLYLENKQGLVRRILRKNPKIVVKSFD